MTKVFVGNISFETTEGEIRTMFAPFGEISGVKVITDRDTGRPRGFAFVEMTQAGDAAKAITALAGTQMAGRAITVNEARPKR